MDIYATVTNKIIEGLETAQRWQKPWTSAFGTGDGTLARPVNAITKRPYSGINVPLLWSTRRSTPYWATFKAWQSAGAHVRRGEKGTTCVFWNRYEVKRDDEDQADEGEPEFRMFAREFTLFNADQVEGWAGAAAPAAPSFDRIATAETFVANTGASVRHGGDRAYYSPAADFIQMPRPEQFTGTTTSTAQEAYYGTLFHELTHWTGAANRTRRDFSGRFGDEAYAFEELVAELGAAFLCADHGLANEPRRDHADYIAHWLKVLRSDKRAIFTAASKAEQAVRFLAGLQLEPVMAMAA